jgi:glycosyltransferase involved in cell wall biosynthesis
MEEKTFHGGVVTSAFDHKMVKPAKIVHITTVHDAYDQRILHRECASLLKAGYDVSLMAKGVINGDHEGVRLISIGSCHREKPGSNLIDRFFNTRRAYRLALKAEADLYHIHDPELIGTAIALKKKTRAKVIYDCHEDNVSYMLQKNYIPAPIRHIMAAVIKCQEFRAGKILDAIVAADEGMCKHFVDRGVSRVTQIENFPRLDLFIKDPVEVLPQYDLVYHGTVPRYHLEICFAVDDVLVRRNIKVTWLFIGKCADLVWAEEMVRKIGAEKRFTFKGMIPHHEIANWVRLGRIGIIPLPDLPKFQRNIPTKLFEFMALKMPVVLSDLPPSRPYVGDGKCAIMVLPDSPNKWADAIAFLLKHPQACKAMGEEGHRRVISCYNWDASFAKLHDLYEELLCTRS